jgi:hypothetical protein
MRNIVLAIIFAVLPASMALAEQSGDQNHVASARSKKTLPVKGGGSRNACAAFGPGFIRLEGTDTCVHVGGAIGIGVGSSGGWR